MLECMPGALSTLIAVEYFCFESWVQAIVSDQSLRRCILLAADAN